jgi:hypothetical protein
MDKNINRASGAKAFQYNFTYLYTNNNKLHSLNKHQWFIGITIGPHQINFVFFIGFIWIVIGPQLNRNTSNILSKMNKYNLKWREHVKIEEFEDTKGINRRTDNTMDKRKITAIYKTYT